MRLDVDCYLAALRATLSLSGRALAEFCAPDGDESTRAFIARVGVPGATNSPCMLLGVAVLDSFLRANGCPAPELAGPLTLARWHNCEAFVKRVAPDAWLSYPKEYVPELCDLVHVEKGNAQHWFTIEDVAEAITSIDGTLTIGEGRPVVQRAERAFMQQPGYALEVKSWKPVVEVVRLSRVLEVLAS